MLVSSKASVVKPYSLTTCTCTVWSAVWLKWKLQVCTTLTTILPNIRDTSNCYYCNRASCKSRGTQRRWIMANIEFVWSCRSTLCKHSCILEYYTIYRRRSTRLHNHQLITTVQCNMYNQTIPCQHNSTKIILLYLYIAILFNPLTWLRCQTLCMSVLFVYAHRERNTIQ